MNLERLVELAREEKRAVESRRWEALLAIRAEQHAILEGLRGQLSADARPILELALARSQATEKALFASLAETQGILERLRAGRRAIHGYRRSNRAGIEVRA
jgi:hypothetical protein